jgi:hypothetical protein
VATLLTPKNNGDDWDDVAEDLENLGVVGVDSADINTKEEHPDADDRHEGHRGVEAHLVRQPSSPRLVCTYEGVIIVHQKLVFAFVKLMACVALGLAAATSTRKENASGDVWMGR